MNWTRFAFGLSDVLSVVLVIRLITLRLHRVYRVFCAFLLFQVLSDSFTIVERFSSLDSVLDYRITWLALRIVSWCLSIWMVYGLLQAILETLPGILRISRRVLNVVWPVSIAVASLSAVSEYLASGAAKVHEPIDFALTMALIVERTVSTVALLSLLLMLLFILWFPVRMPRNLALFSMGFIVYFTAEASLLLVRRFWSHESSALVNLGVSFIMCLCLIYWIGFLNEQGEVAPVMIGHSWQTGRQAELMHNLEGINIALARSSRR